MLLQQLLQRHVDFLQALQQPTNKQQQRRLQQQQLLQYRAPKGLPATDTQQGQQQQQQRSPNTSNDSDSSTSSNGSVALLLVPAARHAVSLLKLTNQLYLQRSAAGAIAFAAAAV